MFPVSDVIPSRTRPVATIALIALTAAAFAYELRLDDTRLQKLVDTLGVTPAHFWWPSVLTSLFLHTGWLHAGSNMLYLWIFGDNVEDAFGRGRFLLSYFACGAAAAVVQAAIHPWSKIGRAHV